MPLENTQKTLLPQRTPKKDKDYGEVEGFCNDMRRFKEIHRLGQDVSHFQVLARIHIFNIICLPSPPGRVQILIKHVRSWRNVFIIQQLNVYTQEGNSTGHLGLLSTGLKS